MDTETAKPSARKFNVLLVMAGAGTSAFLLVLLLSVILGKTETYPHREHQRSFCCSEEATIVLGALNTSVDPCENFYGYVCSRVDSGAVTHYPLVTRAVVSSALIDYAPWGAENTPAGRLLAFLIKGPWQQSTSPAEQLVHYAEAVLKVTALNASTALDINNTLWLFARLSLRYGVPGVLAFTASTTGEVLKIIRNDGCFVDHVNEITSTPALTAVNNALKTSVTMNDVLMLERSLPHRRDARHTESTTDEITRSPFEALSDFEWRALVNEIVVPVYPNVTSVITRKEDKIGDFINVLANITHPPVFIAYTTICAAIRLRNLVEELGETHPHQITTTACEALDVCDLFDRHQASVVSNRVVDDYIRQLFAQIRRNVIEQASSHALLDGVSNQSLETELGRLKLMLPEQIAASDIIVPDISETFPDSYLAARSYIFDVRSAKVARQIPSSDRLFFPTTVIRGDVIYVPTSLYRWLHPSRGKLRELLDFALIGFDLAQNLWSYLLENKWLNETRSNVESRMKCVRSAYLNDSGSTGFRSSVIAALGLPPALDAMALRERRTTYTVNTTELSMGRLLYLLWAYNLCRSVPTVAPQLDVNFALKNSLLFAETFACPRSSHMAKSIECFDKNRTVM